MGIKKFIFGTDKSETINGDDSHHEIWAHGGDDMINSAGGDDKIVAGTGNNTVDGGNGNDQVTADFGDDHITGGQGNDVLHGGVGADAMMGGADRDTFFGTGGDWVDGGGSGDDGDHDGDGDDSNGGHHQNGNDDGEGGDHHDHGDHHGDDDGSAPCFTLGTLILTSQGEIPIERLKASDKVVTRDNGLQEIRWIGTKPLDRQALLKNPHLNPILIAKGALGHALPLRDVMVSPNHRMLITNDKTTLLFEDREVLIAAKYLINGKNIRQVKKTDLSYVHMMFDNHEVVLGEGAWSESFQPGDYAIRGIDSEQRNEIFELFPELRETHGRHKYRAARRSLRRWETQVLYSARH